MAQCPPLRPSPPTRRGPVATIELRRPDALNAWNDDVSRGLTAALEAAAADPEIRAVGLTGAGRAFCSGADLKSTAAPVDGQAPDISVALNERYHPVILAVREMEKPVVALVNGPAVGIGCSLALAADLVLAAESAYFLLAFVNIGLVPDGGSSAFVPARAGLGACRRDGDARRTHRRRAGADWGLVNRVVPDADLASEGEALLERLADGPTRAYAGIKQQLNAWAYAELRRAARARGRPPARHGTDRGLPRGRHGLHRSAAPRSSPGADRSCRHARSRLR